MTIRGVAMWGITRAAVSANGGSISLRLSSERRKLRGLARASGHWAFPGILSMRRSTFAKCCRIRLPLIQSVPSDYASGEGESDVTTPGSPSRGAPGTRCNVRTRRLADGAALETMWTTMLAAIHSPRRDGGANDIGKNCCHRAIVESWAGAPSDLNTFESGAAFYRYNELR